MKLYAKTVMPVIDKDDPMPTDPLALKFWLHDQAMKKKRLEQENQEKIQNRNISGIPGNTID